MLGVFEELQIVFVGMGNSKERIVLLLVVSAVFFVSIVFIVHFICANTYSSITCQQNDYL